MNQYESDLEVVKAWMEVAYPSRVYTSRAGNGCVWISMGMVNMYVFVKDGKVCNVEID